LLQLLEVDDGPPREVLHVAREVTRKLAGIGNAGCRLGIDGADGFADFLQKVREINAFAVAFLSWRDGVLRTARSARLRPDDLPRVLDAA
jgi:hypothetical protein